MYAAVEICCWIGLIIVYIDDSYTSFDGIVILACTMIKSLLGLLNQLFTWI